MENHGANEKYSCKSDKLRFVKKMMENDTHQVWYASINNCTIIVGLPDKLAKLTNLNK